MRVLAANLKLYYQARSLWLYYAAVIPLFFIWLIFSGGPERFSLSIAYLAVCLFSGAITGDLQRTVLTRPFSYLLPNHRKVPAAMLILGACGIFVLGLLCYARVLGYGGPLEPVLAAIFLGILCFFIAAGLAFALGAFVFFAAFFFPLLLSSGTFKALEHMISTFPLFSIVLSLLMCTVILKLLNIESLARRLSGKSTPALSDVFNPARTQKYWQMKSVGRAEKRGTAPSDSLEPLFLRFSERFREGGWNRYVPGNLYLMVGWYLSQSMLWVQIWSIPLVILFFGYLAGGDMRNFIFIFPAFSVVRVDLIPHRPILLARGRSEKLYAALTSGLVLTIFISLIMLLVAVLSVKAAPLLPEISVKGELFSYHPMDIQYFYVCPVYVPLALLLATLYPRQRSLLIAFLAASGIWLTSEFHSWSPASINGILAASGVVAASWLLTIPGISYHCLKQDLVGQSG